MKLVVGLGNYPKEYDYTRHNIGFMVIDKWLNKHSLNLDQNKFNGHFIKFKNNNGEDIIIAKPYTLMNLSGEFVSKLMNFYQIDTTDLLVIMDDVDLPTGQYRIKTSGSCGGQKGMGNIIDHLYRTDLKRIRIGIGRPASKDQMVSWVLGKFTNHEMELIQPAINLAVNIIDDFINDIDFQKIISKYNQKK